MIYLVGNPQLMDNDVYKIATIEECINFCTNLEFIGVDTETNGFDPYTNKVLSLQLGNKQHQYVIDCSIYPINKFKHLLESKKLILQNAKFDLRFLYHAGVFPNQIWDTFLAERVLTAGIRDARKGLDYLAYKYCGAKLDKTVRGFIHRELLSTRVIKYAAQDVEFLEDILNCQYQELEKQKLKSAFELECQFTPVLAYIEYCGFKLDTKAWQSKMDEDIKVFKEAEDKLNQYIIDNNMREFMNTQYDLFNESLETNINWSSSKQVVKFFNSIGIPTKIEEKGVIKDSVDAKHISKHKHPIIPTYLDYKGAEKVVSTYGQNWLNAINKESQRIHTSFTQIMDTGRLSCGGKNKSTGEEYLNFQNIPSDEATRSCFVAEENNTLIVSDYSGQEQIVLANRSLDPNILEFYDQGLGDMHAFVASKMFKELETLSLDEIKKNHKDKRQLAKGAGFAINYGGQGITIANNLNVSLEVGNEVYESYFRAFPGLRNYFDKVKKQGLLDGYILISPITNRKCFLPFYEEYTKLKNEIDSEFWDRYRELKLKNDSEFLIAKDKVSRYFRMKGDIERMGLNYPIQGQSAEITKIACIYLYKQIMELNLINIVKIVNVVHDEIVVECPENMADKMSAIVQDSMEKAGKIYCTRVPLKADPMITKFWSK